MAPKEGIVIDNGASSSRYGFASQLEPHVFPSIVGTSKNKQIEEKEGIIKDTYVGNEANEKREVLNIKNPFEDLEINDWESVEQIWENILIHKLSVDTKEHYVLLSESPVNSKKNREIMAQIMMEKFHLPGLYIGNSAALSFCGMRDTTGTGIVVDIGYTHSYAVPIYNYFPIRKASRVINFGGKYLTEYLHQQLIEKDYSFFRSKNSIPTVNNIKENFTYVPEEYEEDLYKAYNTSSIRRNYNLPVGTNIFINEERFLCTKLLFEPSIIDLECDTIHDMTNKSIQSCVREIRGKIFKNIKITGGTSRIPGFLQKFNVEMIMLEPPYVRARVYAHDNIRYSTWVGGSILASSDPFQSKIITKEEYHEFGTDIFNHKFAM